MFRKCPSCQLVFQAKEVKRELLDADKHIQKDYLAPPPMKWEWQDNFDKETYFHYYRVTYKCKHCGYEWADLIQKK